MQRLPLDDDRWLTFVARRENADPFHHPAWALLLQECYGMHGFVLASTDAGGELRAGVPVLVAPRLPGRGTRWVSLPFTDSLAPLATAEVAPLLAEQLDRERREHGVSRLELHGRLAGAHALPTEA